MFRCFLGAAALVFVAGTAVADPDDGNQVPPRTSQGDPSGNSLSPSGAGQDSGPAAHGPSDPESNSLAHPDAQPQSGPQSQPQPPQPDPQAQPQGTI
jgi:hypothetical protein